MAAIIKPIEAKSVHQIQSGQVIVDLCSVVKELVENALDAGASSIEVRFKNYGLDAVEVQDNGSGIAAANYDKLALKHYTSKLSSYDDLTTLSTFGFRGEALSSLCALSRLSVITAQAHEAPKGKKLEFETSGKLASTSLVATSTGTTVFVENIFAKLPVRQKELTKNVKREYGKVIGLLQAYACVSTNVRFTIKTAPNKGKSIMVFSTKGNGTTRDNIANVYGAKVLPQLIELGLKLNFRSSYSHSGQEEDPSTVVEVQGHISRPVFGEGRQTPDRQLFYVNGRPCGLPQLAKAFNEVYKSYNVSQSPFIFADFRMDTNSYDVNVSPDKRTVFLHDASILTDKLKEELTLRFDKAEQTVPQVSVSTRKLPAFRQLTMSRESSEGSNTISAALSNPSEMEHGSPLRGSSPSESDEETTSHMGVQNLFKNRFQDIASTRTDPDASLKARDSVKAHSAMEKRAEKIALTIDKHEQLRAQVDDCADAVDLPVHSQDSEGNASPLQIRARNFKAGTENNHNGNFNDETATGITQDDGVRRLVTMDSSPEASGVVPNAFSRMRPIRSTPEVATITIGDRVITRVIGGSSTQERTASRHSTRPSVSRFSQSLRRFNDVPDDASDQENDPDEADHGEDSEIVTDDDEAAVIRVDPIEQHVGAQDNPKRASENASTELNNELSRDSPLIVRDASHIDKIEAADRTQEEFRVAELIRRAETTNYTASRERQKRTNQAMKTDEKNSSVDTVAVLETDLASILGEAQAIIKLRKQKNVLQSTLVRGESMDGGDEERLSLTIAKKDFERMHIAGQFNLGFIIAVRHKDINDRARQRDEVFIVDQHASDEKYNFERLQQETVVGNQRLVHPIQLELTAVEEEIVLENEGALRQNGFIIDADTSGDSAIGDRCRLLTLPISKELTFNTKDLEELIHLLSEAHISADSDYIPRPTKVRKMFAMRACRSSIMIGRTLSQRQMRAVLDHMGKLDKPWNCPHGRPTMRHLISLDQLDGHLWREGDGLASEADAWQNPVSDVDKWRAFAACG